MKQIEINVNNKIACLVDEEQYLVCGNNDYEVVFHFDEQWSGVNAKTALFVFGQEPIAMPFEGNVCEGVAIEGATLCGIGVFAGNLKTSTGAYIKCLPSIRDNGGIPKPPTPEVYDKIMEMLDKAMQAHTELPKGGEVGQVLKKKSEKDYDVEWVDDKTLDPNLYATKADLKPLVDDIAEHGNKIELLERQDGFFDSHLQEHSAQINDLFTMYDALSVSVGTAQTTLSEVVDGGAFV